MKMKIKLVSLITMIWSLAMIWPAGARDVNIDISRFESRKINIAVADFLYSGPDFEDNWGGQVAAILKNDLNLSGYFSQVEIGDNQKLQKLNVDLKELGSLGIDALVNGKITVTGDKVEIECYLYDADSQVRIVGIRYKANKDIFRRTIHNFSDEIIYRYTGEKGIAETKICFTGDLKGDKEVYAVDYDGYGFHKITNENSLVLLPRWTADAKKIAYTSYKAGNPDLYIVNEDGSGRRTLSSCQGLNSMARFSNDGKYLAVVLSKDGNPDIYIMTPAGAVIRRLTGSRAIDSSPSWSPSNSDIVFISDRSGAPQLYVTDSDGVNVRRLVYNNNYVDSPAWSPTGERIAYVVRVKNEINIYTTDVNGNFQQQLTSGSGRNENPSWSPDGRFIAFVSNRNGKSQLYIMNNDGSNQRPLFPGELADQFKGNISTPDWSLKQE